MNPERQRRPSLHARFAGPNDGVHLNELHTPIFVPLVEAAPLLKDEREALSVCATVAARRGLPLNYAQLETLVANGHAAFFFDGLDEVPSMEQRARLTRSIGHVVDSFAPLGNRVVLTSRPAALDALEVPKALTALHLRYLSTDEIRMLARKILSMQLTEEGQQVGFGANDSREASIIDKLMTDCDAKPGIGRLARNPLLLSLLVMIYANSGAPSAKKHRIYAQAVQTLVSVRNRVAGTTVLSESDLRRRLGEVALSIYENKLPELPTRDAVVGVVASVLASEEEDGDGRTTAEAFIQKVAEGTGLLTVHAVAASKGDATITFMHHSFLEYYAAAGLVGYRAISSLPSLAEVRRWREVVSLAAGLIGDHADVAPLIEQLLIPRRKGDGITQTHLLFAFDCALECDVPPEKAQRALSAAVTETMYRGAGRVDGSFRHELAERMARLWEATGSTELASCLTSGLQSRDIKVVACYVDLIGRIGVHSTLPPSVIAGVEQMASRKESAVKIALYGAAGRCRELRGDGIVQALKTGFSDSFPVKYAAVRAVEDAPSLSAGLTEVLKSALDDPQLPVAAAAARALLESGVEVASADARNRLLVEKCLRRWEQLAEPRSAAKLRILARREDVDRMLSSPAEDERALAIRLLPWLERQEMYVHERLFEIIALNRSSTEVVASLASLRLAGAAAALCSSANIDSLIALAKDSARSRDVRTAAVRALAVLPPEERVVSALLDRCRVTEHGEYRECMRAIATCAPANDLVRSFVSESLRDGLGGPLRGEFGKPPKQYDFKRTMRIAGELGVDVASNVAIGLAKLAESFKAPEELRSQAIRTYARVAPVTPQTVEQVVSWLRQRSEPFASVVPSVVAEILGRAKQRVEHVRAIYPLLSSLEDALIEEWERVGPERARYTDDYAFRGLRSTLRELHDISSAFSEFAAKSSRAGAGGLVTNLSRTISEPSTTGS